MLFKHPITPYLLRATYDWIVDAHFVPYIEVDTFSKGIEIPTQFKEEQTVVFNVSTQAVNKLKIDNLVVEFDARFSSQISHLIIPISSIIAIYARENGFGMQFIPTIEYLGDTIEIAEFDLTQKTSVSKKLSTLSTLSKKSNTHSESKTKLKLITKDDIKDRSNGLSKNPELEK